MLKLKNDDYAVARVLLDSVLNKEGRVTYEEVAARVSVERGCSVNPHYGLSDSLGRVSELCCDLGLPMLSVTVIYKGISKKDKVAEGFYDKACELRPEYIKMSPKEAWTTELERMRKCTEWDRLIRYLEKVER